MVQRLSSFYYICLAVALLSVSACSTTPSSGTYRSDSQVGSEDEAAGQAYGVDRSDLGNFTPGSQEELVETIGDRVFYGFNSAVLSSQAQQVLDQQADWLRQHANLTVTIEGHCDERGTREYNLALGERRANAAKRYLIGLGIAANRISTISYGKERPAVLGSNETAWRENRRAVTVVNQWSIN